jgi:copper chaperone
MMKTIKVKGMTCNHCAMAVTKALQRVDGIGDVTVDLEKGEARFEETKAVPLEAIREQIAKAGYEVG